MKSKHLTMAILSVLLIFPFIARGEDHEEYEATQFVDEADEDESVDQVAEVIEDWETYYEEDNEVDVDFIGLLLEESNPFREPANAFKFKRMRGVSRSHKGIDYAAPCGTKVPSKSAGEVTKVGTGSGYGKVVAVRVGNCTQIYAHLSRFSVSVGQKVRAGTVLGYSGNTGRSRGPTGCHLHYESCSKLYNKQKVKTGKYRGTGKPKNKKSTSRR